MQPTDFTGTNLTLGKPPGWDEEKFGPCIDIRVMQRGSYVISGWLPSPEEIERIVAGKPVFVHVVGHSMPPMWVDVGD